MHLWCAAGLNTCMGMRLFMPHPVSGLQAWLESREGVGRLSAALKARGLTEEHFACLLEVLVPDET